MLRRPVAGGVLAVVLALGGSGVMPAEVGAESVVRVAQVTPGQVTGRWDENRATLPEVGRYYAVHEFEGTAREVVSIDLVSDEFDAYLFLVGPDGNVFVQDDDGGEGTNARLMVELPATGQYQVIVTTYGAGEVEEYALSWGSASRADLELQRAGELNQQACQLFQQGLYNEAEPLLEEALSIRREQLGTDHPSIATSLNNLAGLYQDQGKYGQAEPLYQRSLACFGVKNLARIR